MKIAAIQLNAGQDKKKNLKKAVHMVETAVQKGAVFIALPEVFNFRGPLNKRTLSAVSEKIPGPSCEPFLKISRAKKVFILLGSLYEQSAKQKAYNASVLIGDNGRIIGKYRKNNLFTAVVGKKNINEARWFLPGKKGTLARAAGFRIGMSVCYDLRFPQMYQKYARQGCDLLTVPSSFTRSTGQAHWESLLRARAIENMSYVVAPNQTGKDGNGVVSYGNSMIVSPWGEILARASGTKEEIIFAQVTKEKIKEARQRMPAMLNNKTT